MKRDEARFLADDPDEQEEVEIIEVVGLDGDGTPRTDEIEVTFEDEQAAAPVAAPRVADAPAAGLEEPGAHERLLRLRADFENLKKRIERERDDYYRHATASLVARLLPVLDNFERAMDSARRTADAGAVLEGVTLIHRQLLEELRREGLRAVEALGRPFDPAVHEAVATDSSSRLPANTIVEEMQRGYFFEDRLLRPALVRVAVSETPDEAPILEDEGD